MKPDNEQVLAIRQYLTRHLKYRETKDELFDHILTALEYMPADVPFGVAMNRIIAYLGGLKKLKSVERAARLSVIKAMLKRYFECVKYVFTSVIIVGVVAFAGAVYLINAPDWVERYIGFYVPVMGFFIAITLLVVRRFKGPAPVFDIKNAAFGLTVPLLMFLPQYFYSAVRISCYKFDIPFSPAMMISVLFLITVHVAAAMRFIITELTEIRKSVTHNITVK